MHVGAGHINLGTQHHGAFLKFTTIHLVEKFQILFYRSVPVGTWCSRSGRCTFLGSYLFWCLFIDVCLTFLDELYSEIPQLLEIVGCIVFVPPLESKPLDILFDSFHIFYIFLSGIGIVKTEIADTSIFLCNTEVHTNSLGMTDMKIAIGFRRKACLNTSIILAFQQVLFYNLFNKIEAFLCHLLFAGFTHNENGISIIIGKFTLFH